MTVSSRFVMHQYYYKEMEQSEVIQQIPLWEDFWLSIQLKGYSKSSAPEPFLVPISLHWLQEMQLLWLVDLNFRSQQEEGTEEYPTLQMSDPILQITSFTMSEMIKLFNSKGLSLDDLVTLSGAHTIGSAHCNAFSDRFRMDSEGKLTLIDKSLESSYAEELMKKCPSDSSASKTVNNDPEKSLAFDNQCYSNLLAHKGLFQSGSVLLEDGRTRAKVEAFANDQESFSRSWGESFLKLTAVGVKTDDQRRRY